QKRRSTVQKARPVSGASPADSFSAVEIQPDGLLASSCSSATPFLTRSPRGPFFDPRLKSKSIHKVAWAMRTVLCPPNRRSTFQPFSRADLPCQQKNSHRKMMSPPPCAAANRARAVEFGTSSALRSFRVVRRQHVPVALVCADQLRRLVLEFRR